MSFMLLGLIVLLLLGAGTWLPVVSQSSPEAIMVALLLSCVWSVIGWRWLAVLAQMRQIPRAVTLEATIDQITVLQELRLRESRVVFPAAEVRIEDSNGMRTLTSPDNTWAMRCEDTQSPSTWSGCCVRCRSAPWPHRPLSLHLQPHWRSLAVLQGLPGLYLKIGY